MTNAHKKRKRQSVLISTTMGFVSHAHSARVSCPCAISLAPPPYLETGNKEIVHAYNI